MTPRERAEAVHIRLQRVSNEARQLGAIEQAIIAAIEAERAACAVIVGDYANKIDALNVPDEAKEYARLLREGFILANEEIRARGAK